MGCVTLKSVPEAPGRISLTNITAVSKSVTWKLDLWVVLPTYATSLLLPPAVPEMKLHVWWALKEHFVTWGRSRNFSTQALDCALIQCKDEGM